MRTRTTYDWSDPATLAANRRGEITPAQRALVGHPLNLGCVIVSSATFLACIAAAGVAAAHNAAGDYTGLVLLALGALLLIPLLFSVNLRSARERRAVAAGRLVRTHGQVVWRGKRYVAEIAGGRRLRPIPLLGLPPPGPYDFFYLAGSRRLLSAEPLRGALVPPSGAFAEASGGGEAVSTVPAALPGADADDEPARLAVLNAFAHTVGFGPDDLRANRLGHLSVSQRWRLRRRLIGETAGIFGGAIFGAAFVLVGLMIVAYLVFPGQAQALMRQVDEHGVPAALLVPGALAVGAFLLFAATLAASLSARTLSGDLRAGRVATIEGAVHREVDSSGEGPPSYYFVVGELRFEVGRLAQAALIDGRAYRLYYLPRSHTLLSMEPLGTGATPGGDV